MAAHVPARTSESKSQKTYLAKSPPRLPERALAEELEGFPKDHLYQKFDFIAIFWGTSDQ
jgi:hypothetical protein